MKAVFFDLEMNQPSNKIIEIGAVTYNLKLGNKLASFHCHVNPHEILNPTITTLTGIQQEQVDAAQEIKYALREFFDWFIMQGCGGKLVCWGQDALLIRRVARELGMEVPKILELNFKEMFKWTKAARRLPEKGGLAASMKELRMEFEGEPHRALNDADNLARLGVTQFKILESIFRIRDVVKEMP